MTDLLEVDRLRCWFDVSRKRPFGIGHTPRNVRAVDDVSFTIPQGKTFCLVGESGCGKSTIAKLVVGLLRQTSGTVRIDGKELKKGSRAEQQALRRRVQMVFQDPYASLNPSWTVGQSVAEPLIFDPAATAASMRERVAELLTLVGMHPDDADRLPHQFSGGQRQRIAIARALSTTPEFLVCDEPTSALDVSVQAQILNLMKDLQDKLGLTYLLITHNLAVVNYMADTVGVMYLGRLVEVGPRDQVFHQPRHPYTRMLMDAVPEIDEPNKAIGSIRGEIPSPLDPPTGCAFHPRCPLARDVCRSKAPELQDSVACHAWHDPEWTRHAAE